MITIISAVKLDKYDRYQTRFGTFVTVGAMQQWRKKKQRETFAVKILSFVDQFRGLSRVGLWVDLGVHAKFPLFRSIILSFNLVSSTQFLSQPRKDFVHYCGTKQERNVFADVYIDAGCCRRQWWLGETLSLCRCRRRCQRTGRQSLIQYRCAIS